LICAGPTYSNGTGVSFTATDTPASSRGSGVPPAVAVAVAKFVPKIETSDPGAICGAPLAVLTIPAEVMKGPAGVTEKGSRLEKPDEVETERRIVPGCEIRRAAMTADSWLELSQVVGSGCPFHKRLAPGRKPLPLAVNVNSALPAVIVCCDRDDNTGAVPIRVKTSAFDTEPPGVDTVIEFVPGAPMRLAGTDAVSWEAETKVVGNGFPFQRTVEFVKKLDPATASVRLDIPAVADAGFSAVMAGPRTERESPLDLFAPGLTTVTVTVPDVDSRFAGTLAVSDVLLTTVVMRAVPFQ